MIDGRVLAGQDDLGSGFGFADRMVVTAGHVVGERCAADLSFVISGVRHDVEEVRVSRAIDIALLRIARSIPVVPALTAHQVMAQWRVTSRPKGNDPVITGVITAERGVLNIHDHEVTMLQLRSDETVGNFGGYSGSAVLIGEAVVAVLVEQLKERLSRAAGSKATNVLYAVPIQLVVDEFGLSQRVRPYEANPRPSGQLLDAAFFDLDRLKSTMLDVIYTSGSRVIGFAVEYPDSVLHRKLRDWLLYTLGAAEARDSLTLDPRFTSVEGAVASVARYGANLQVKGIVLPVQADRASCDFVAAFWDAIVAHCGEPEYPLILLFSGSPTGGYPKSVHSLPPPEFAADDIQTWVRHIAASKSWTSAIADAWRDAILEQAYYDHKLSVRHTLETLEYFIDQFHFKQEELLTMLKKRSRNAHAAPR